jgi:ubiquitin-protein ligase E3 B
LFKIFYPHEIDLLISGGQSEIDIYDLKKYSRPHNWNLQKRDEVKYLDQFWDFMAQQPNDMKEKLLKFVTGLERQPLLGFKYLNPPFIVNKIPVESNQIKLPASHTCANVLDLPYYGNT